MLLWERYLTASDAIALASLMLQRGTMRIQNAIAALAALSLSGCSYICDLKVIVLNGKIAFIVDPDSKRQANCITSIHVQATTGETARAALDPRDDEKLVRNGVFWWKDFDTRDCPGQDMAEADSASGKIVPWKTCLWTSSRTAGGDSR